MCVSLPYRNTSGHKVDITRVPDGISADLHAITEGGASAKPEGVINGPRHSAMIKDALLKIIRRKMSP